MEWYYEINKEQHGPVSTEVLQGLLNAGTISESNLVWKRGMTGWEPIQTAFKAYFQGERVTSVDCPTCGRLVSPAALIPAEDGQVCPQCRDTSREGFMEGVISPGARGRKGRGTGGATSNVELRRIAREALAGKWGIAVGAVFVYGVVLQLIAIVPVLGQVAQLFIAGPLILGLTACFMRIVRNDAPAVSAVFGGLSSFGLGLGIYFVMTLIVLLCAMGAAIPGVIMVFATGAYQNEESLLFAASVLVGTIPAVIVGTYMYLQYALAYYIANDEPELGVFESLKKSSRMMDGHKGKLFMLMLSFIGWIILGMLALLVGLLWSAAYYSAAIAAFYDDLAEDV